MHSIKKISDSLPCTKVVIDAKSCTDHFPYTELTVFDVQTMMLKTVSQFQNSFSLLLYPKRMELKLFELCHQLV